jgi:hypothetical protein
VEQTMLLMEWQRLHWMWPWFNPPHSPTEHVYKEAGRVIENTTYIFFLTFSLICMSCFFPYLPFINNSSILSLLVFVDSLMGDKLLIAEV